MAAAPVPHNLTGLTVFIDTHIIDAMDEAAIAARFSGFRMWSPEDALAEAAARIRGLRELHRREPNRGGLPAWPAETGLPRTPG